jgi:hypothetical protein
MTPTPDALRIARVIFDALPDYGLCENVGHFLIGNEPLQPQTKKLLQDAGFELLQLVDDDLK